MKAPKNYFLFFLGLTSLIMTSALAKIDDVGDQYYGDHSGQTKKAPEVVEWTGIVQCANTSHIKTGECDIEFIRNSDGKSFDIIEDNGLVARHCSKHRDLEVILRAEKTPRFLFSGGNLIVKDFTVKKELPLKKANERNVRRGPTPIISDRL